nr:unnamed protein product [Spirometra erinaceieuropaei]
MNRLAFRPTLLLLFYIACIHGHHQTNYYDLCLKGSKQCTQVSYQKTDLSRGADCRSACATGPDQSSKDISATYRDANETTPVNYKVIGRAGHAESFARHVQCVLICELVADSLENKADWINMCICKDRECGSFPKWNNTFDNFKDCWSKCNGWMNVENAVIERSYVCKRTGGCQEFFLYEKSENVDFFHNLVSCINKCQEEKGLRYKCDQQRKLCNPCSSSEEDCQPRSDCSQKCMPPPKTSSP